MGLFWSRDHICLGESPAHRTNILTRHRCFHKFDLRFTCSLDGFVKSLKMMLRMSSRSWVPAFRAQRSRRPSQRYACWNIKLINLRRRYFVLMKRVLFSFSLGLVCHTEQTCMLFQCDGLEYFRYELLRFRARPTIKIDGIFFRLTNPFKIPPKVHMFLGLSCGSTAPLGKGLQHKNQLRR